MAGGMSKRGSWGSMADRVAQAGGPGGPPESPPPPPAQPAAGRPAGDRLPAGVKHCWVIDPGAGAVPGLLLSWRNDEVLGWLGRVVRPVRDEGGWLVAEDWLPAEQLRPAGRLSRPLS